MTTLTSRMIFLTSGGILLVTMSEVTAPVSPDSVCSAVWPITTVTGVTFKLLSLVLLIHPVAISKVRQITSGKFAQILFILILLKVSRFAFKIVSIRINFRLCRIDSSCNIVFLNDISEVI